MSDLPKAPPVPVDTVEPPPAHPAQATRRVTLWRILFWAAVAMPPAFIVVLVARWGVNAPVWDDWELAALLQGHQDGTLRLTDFLEQHNEHRVIFPTLLLYGLAVVTRWNIGAALAANIVFAAVTFWFLLQIIRRTFDRRGFVAAATLLTSVVIFSPVQFGNWLWGWQVEWFMNVTGLVVGIWALSAWRTPSPWRRYAVAAVAATVATYSLGSGMFVWLVCLPLLFVTRELRRLVLPWIVAGAVIVGANFIDYSAGADAAASHPLQHPIAFLTYVEAYLTRPLVSRFDLAMINLTAVAYLLAAVAVMGYAIWRMRSQVSTRLLPWLVLGAYPVLASLITGMSRLKYGPEQAFASRYTTLSLLAVLALIMVALRIVESSWSGPNEAVGTVAHYGSVAVLGVLVWLVAVSYVSGVAGARITHHNQLKANACVKRAQSALDPCLTKTLYPSGEIVWARIQFLREAHLNGR